MVFIYFNSKKNLKTTCQKHLPKLPKESLENEMSQKKNILEKLKPNSIERLSYWCWCRSNCLNGLFFSLLNILKKLVKRLDSMKQSLSKVHTNEAFFFFTLVLLSVWETTSAVPSDFFQFEKNTSTFCGTALNLLSGFLGSFLTTYQVKEYEFTGKNRERKIWLAPWYYSWYNV